VTLPSALVLATLLAAPVSATRAVSETEYTPREDEARSRSARVSKDWMLSVEAVTRVPVDAGAQLGLETPFGLRVFGGYGWVPYIDVLTGAVVSASDRNIVTAFLDGTRVSGNSARVVLGFRPFRRLGAYFDASYAHLRLNANASVQSMTVQNFVFPGGVYQAKTGIDLWGIELGYQGLILQRLVLGGAVGVSGAIDSRTNITPVGSAPNDPALPAAAQRVDRAFQSHVLPTLTLRVGFDAI
jgi:hypothetical protein